MLLQLLYDFHQQHHFSFYSSSSPSPFSSPLSPVAPAILLHRIATIIFFLSYSLHITVHPGNKDIGRSVNACSARSVNKQPHQLLAPVADNEREKERLVRICFLYRTTLVPEDGSF